MGVPVNNPGSNRENCPKISTACVIWQGPDIPCIDLCAGDAVDEVVFKLATYVCALSENIFNIDNVDFSCLIPPDGPRPVLPTNLEELIQFLIEYVCNNSSTSAPLLRLQDNESVVILPPELAYYDDNGDYITVLRQSQYSAYIASKLVETISLLDTTEGKANTSETDIIALQVQIDDLPTSSTNDIYVVSQCASSGTPGQQILIQNAFTTFERNYCNLTSVIGTSTTLYGGINSQIANLSNLPQLMNNALQMRAIPRWSTSVSDIGTSISNLWLTVNDMRSKIIQIANATFDVPCILLSPENMTIGTIGTSFTEVYWEKSSVTSVQPPTSYSIQVFALTDTTFSNPLYSGSRTEIEGVANVINIASANIVVDVEYVIRIKSIYGCGMSAAASLVSKLLAAVVVFEVKADITTLAPVSLTCTDALAVDTNYDLIQKTIKFDIYNITTGLPAINGTSNPITVIARFVINSCDFGVEPVYEDVTFEIQPGDSFSDTYEFVAEKLTNCIDGSCGPYEKELSCGVFVSDPTIQFDRDYGSC